MQVDTKKTSSIKQRVSKEEWEVRVDLAAAYRLVSHFGWDDLIFTHISARLPGAEHHFLINPYGLLFEEITASNLVKVDLEGKIVDATVHKINPAGFTIHSAIHAAREDAHCVLHLHTVAGTAVSSQAKGLLPANQTAMVLNSEIAYHDYEGLALNHEERPRLVADLGSKSAMLLRNHGTLTVGHSVGAAFLTMYFLERACAMQVASASGNADLIIPGDAVQELVSKQAKYIRQEDGDLAWSALVRMLDRRDPSFRE